MLHGRYVYEVHPFFIILMDVLHLNRNAWDAIGKKVASPYLRKNKFRSTFNTFCAALPRNARVLDLGCGPGIPVTRALVRKKFRVTGIDLSEEMVSLARKNVPQATFSRVSITDIPYREEFDGIVASYSLLCLNPKNFRKAAARISRALKKGGFFLLALNEPPPGHTPKEDVVTILGQRMYSRPYTEREVREIFGKQHLRVVQVERETVRSRMFGVEHSLLMLLEKK